MSKKKKVIVVPADTSRESIMKLVCISNVTGRGWSGARTEVVRFSGTLEERLQQYRDAFGKEWPGFSEQTYTTIIEDKSETPSAPLFGGVEVHKPLPLSPEMKAFKEKLEARARNLVVKLDKEHTEWLENREEPSEVEVPVGVEA